MMFYIKNSLLFLLGLLSISIQAQTTTVSGIISFGDTAMTNVTVTINAGDFSASTTTNEAGNYSFENVPETADLKVDLTVEKDLNPLNGVSTFDLVIGLKHILAITPFETANEYIAMDINKSGSVTVLDLIHQRNLILGIVTEFPNNQSWRFVEETQLNSITFAQENTPEYEPNIAGTYTLTSGQPTILNFVGIKIGDATGNADRN